MKNLIQIKFHPTPSNKHHPTPSNTIQHAVQTVPTCWTQHVVYNYITIWVLFMPISIKLVKCVQIHLVLCNNRISNLFDLNEFSNEENHIRVLLKNSFL